METESKLGLPGVEALYLMDTEFQFCKMKRVVEVDGSNHCMTIYMYTILLNCTPKNGGKFYVMDILSQFLELENNYRIMISPFQHPVN